LTEEFRQIALLLQGGGALASYQAGAYEALSEFDVELDWIVGISSGALNAAIIAGNPPQARVGALRSFWRSIGQAMTGYPGIFAAMNTFMFGLQGFFRPKILPSFVPRCSSIDAESWYDASPLRATLARFADFDRINDPREMPVSLGVVNARSGECHYFDNKQTRLRPEHFLASCALPPGFAPVEIDGDLYWDAGLVSNTPLECLVYEIPCIPTTAFQVNLWSPPGAFPCDPFGIVSAMQDLGYLSRAKVLQAAMHDANRGKRIIRELVTLTPGMLHSAPPYVGALRYLNEAEISVIDLTYDDAPCDAFYKAFDFSYTQTTIHWENGLKAMRRMLERQLS
jgi:NTE family protein